MLKPDAPADIQERIAAIREAIAANAELRGEANGDDAKEAKAKESVYNQVAHGDLPAECYELTSSLRRADPAARRQAFGESSRLPRLPADLVGALRPLDASKNILEFFKRFDRVMLQQCISAEYMPFALIECFAHAQDADWPWIELRDKLRQGFEAPPWNSVKALFFKLYKPRSSGVTDCIDALEHLSFTMGENLPSFHADFKRLAALGEFKPNSPQLVRRYKQALPAAFSRQVDYEARRENDVDPPVANDTDSEYVYGFHSAVITFAANQSTPTVRLSAADPFADDLAIEDALCLERAAAAATDAKHDSDADKR